MFSQLSSFANKLSLDNLQEDGADNSSAPTEASQASSEAGAGVASIFGKSLR